MMIIYMVYFTIWIGKDENIFEFYTSLITELCLLGPAFLQDPNIFE